MNFMSARQSCKLLLIILRDIVLVPIVGLAEPWLLPVLDMPAVSLSASTRSLRLRFLAKLTALEESLAGITMVLLEKGEELFLPIATIPADTSSDPSSSNVEPVATSC
jgi:hypothetical protein